MVQVLDSGKPGMGSLFGQGLVEGFRGSLANIAEDRREKRKQQATLDLLKSIQGNQMPVNDLAEGAPKPRSNSPSSLQNIEDDERLDLQLAAINPEIAKVRSAQTDRKRKSFESDRKYHSSRSAPFLNKVTELAEGLDEREVALNSAEQAVKSGQIKPFGGDFWAKTLNLPQLATESGAALQSAAKVNLIGSLGKVGARPNQFIEQQIDNAFAKAGQSEGANLAQINIAKSVLDLNKKYVDITENLSNQYRKDLGYVPENIDSLVREQMKPYAKKRMEKLSYDLQEGVEKSQKPKMFQSTTKGAPGTPLTSGKYKVFFNKATGATEEERDANAIKMAKMAGYRIVDESVFEDM